MLKVLASCNEGDEDLSRLTLSNELVLAVCKQEDWTSKQEKTTQISVQAMTSRTF